MLPRHFPAHGFFRGGAVLAGLSCALIALAPSRPASAAPSPTQANRARAKALFERAEKTYYLGHFEEARKLYAKAYKAAPLPGFLYNIGQCHRMLKQYEKAIFFYKGYLQATDASNQKVVRRLIQTLEKKLAREAARRALPARRAPPAATRATPPPYMPSQPPAPETPLVRRWWFWTAIGGGTALVIAAVLGGVLGARASGSEGASAPGTSLGTLDRR